MRTLVLQRGQSTPEGTVGDAHADDALLSIKTLELGWHDNEPRHSCIPPGDYVCLWQLSPSKGWCYHVTNVPGRTHILFHRANFAGDVRLGWESELLGCIAPGTYVGPMENALDPSRIQLAIHNSKIALHRLEEWGAREPFVLRILPART